MAEPLRIRPAQKIYGVIVMLLFVLTVFLFWLALSASNLMVGLPPAVFATALGWSASILIRRPFILVLNEDGLLIKTPFGDSFYNWSEFESFAIKYADPLTKHIVFRLKPDVDVPPSYQRLRLADHEVGLFPYFEIENNELMRIMRQYRYSS